MHRASAIVIIQNLFTVKEQKSKQYEWWRNIKENDRMNDARDIWMVCLGDGWVDGLGSDG